LALAYLTEINHLAEVSGLQTPDNILSTLLNMPDVMQSEKNELAENEWKAVLGVIEEAADSLMKFRQNEGARLAEDIAERVKSIEKLRVGVEQHLPQRLAGVRER